MSNLIVERAKIATLKMGSWRATKLHKDETRDENQRHGTNDVVKSSVVLTKHPALELLSKHHANTRNDHYRLTLPCGEEGLRFLPVGREFEHAELMRAAKEEHNKLRDQFLADYDSERETAPARLNGLYRPQFFPPLAQVAAKFRFESSYLPVPSEGAWQDWIGEAAAQATEELRDRFHSALSAMVSSLSQPDKIFRDSLVLNIRDLACLAGDLNLANDAQIAAAAAAARELGDVDPETLRANSDTRAETARKAQNILTALGGATL